MRWTGQLAFIVALALSGADPAFAASSATLQVTATVLPFVSFQAVQHVATYRVNGDDIKRGYVDLPASVTVNVRTNIAAGVPVAFESAGDAKILIRESGRGEFADGFFTLDTGNYRPNTPISKRYDFRVLIPSEAKDGTYPLAISMAPTI